MIFKEIQTKPENPQNQPPLTQKATLLQPGPHFQPSQRFIRQAIIYKTSKHPCQHHNCFQLDLRKQQI